MQTLLAPCEACHQVPDTQSQDAQDTSKVPANRSQMSHALTMLVGHLDLEGNFPRRALEARGLEADVVGQPAASG